MAARLPRRLLPPACLLLAAALVPVGCGPSDETGRIIIESATLVTVTQNPHTRFQKEVCQVQGNVFNATKDKTCDAPLEFLAYDAEDTVIGDASTTVEQIPPKTRSAYTAVFQDRRGTGELTCDEIVRFQSVPQKATKCTSPKD